jgi:hypothetical protein
MGHKSVAEISNLRIERFLHAEDVRMAAAEEREQLRSPVRPGVEVGGIVEADVYDMTLNVVESTSPFGTLAGSAPRKPATSARIV